MKHNEINNVTKTELIGYAIRLGVRSLFCGDVHIAIKRIILPINYWRITIFQLVSNYIFNSEYMSKSDIRILDIGSPKLLSLFLGSKIKGRIYATDLCDNAIFSEWCRHYRNTSKKENVIFEYADARGLKYPNKYFDVIFSISVVHMVKPEVDGDVVAITEMQKKIRSGGSLIIEVPFRGDHTMRYSTRNYINGNHNRQSRFIERQYDAESLKTNIENNVQGNLINKIFIYEKLPFDAVWNRLPRIITTLLAFIEPLAEMLNVSIANEEIHFRKARSVLLIFRMD